VKSAILVIMAMLLGFAATPSSAIKSGRGVLSGRFEGAINGKLPICMDVRIYPDGKLVGSYYYNKSKVSIPISGKLDKSNEFEMVEIAPRDEKNVKRGDVNGYFKGNLDPQFIRMTGMWSNASGTINFPFDLDVKDKPNITGRMFNYASAWNRPDFKEYFPQKEFAEVLHEDGNLTWKLVKKEPVIINKTKYLFAAYEHNGIGSIVAIYKQHGAKMIRVGGYEYDFGGNGGSCSVKDWKVAGEKLEMRLGCIGYFHQTMPEGEMPPTDEHERIVILDLD